MKTRNLLSILATGIIIIGAVGCKSKKNQDLNSREPNCARTSVDPNSRIIMQMGEFKTYYEEPNYIDPNLLRDYMISYDAPKLAGEIIEGKLGYFENNRFIVPNMLTARNIENLDEIFNPIFNDYRWRIIVKKPTNERNENFVKKYPNGFRIKQQMDKSLKYCSKVLTSNIYIFPKKDYGETYECLSHKIIFVWNKNISGLYKKPEVDINDVNNKPSDCLYFIQGVEEGSLFKILTE